MAYRLMRAETCRAFTAALSALILPVLLSGCDRETLPTYRYRMSVEVDTPQGLKTGSSVIEVKTEYAGKGFPGPEAGGMAMSARGEAVAVDLPGGQVLFALLSGADGSGTDWAARVMRSVAKRPPLASYNNEKSPLLEENKLILANILALKGAPPKVLAITPSDDLMPPNQPMLVRFKNLADPKSVEAVAADALEKSFGPGIKLRRITVQITDDKVTTGIGKRLVWLENLASQGARLNGSDSSAISTNELSDNLGTGSFKARM